MKRGTAFLAAAKVFAEEKGLTLNTVEGRAVAVFCAKGKGIFSASCLRADLKARPTTEWRRQFDYQYDKAKEEGKL